MPKVSCTGVAGVLFFVLLIINSSFAANDDDQDQSSLAISQQQGLSNRFQKILPLKHASGARQKPRKQRESTTTTTLPTLNDAENTTTTAIPEETAPQPEQTESDLIVGNFGSFINELANGSRTILKWNNGVIYYKFDSNVTSEHSQQIREGMNNLTEITCGLKFERLDDPKKLKETHQSQPIVRFQNSDSTVCASSIGMQQNKSSSEQKVLFGDACYTEPGVIMQILMHLVGFPHEHQRADRDKYISVDFSNILPDRQVQFIIIPDKSAPKEWTSEPYDLDSITHYDEYAHSYVPDRLRTITVRKVKGLKYDRENFGKHEQLSESDKKRLKKMYPCRQK